MVSDELARELLGHAGAWMVVRKSPNRKLMLGDNAASEISQSYDLRQSSVFSLIVDAFAALQPGPNRLIRLVDASRKNPDTVIEVVIDEAPMVAGMYDYSVRIMTLSVVISLITAALVFLSLHRLMVRPMRRITASMVAFRENPQDLKNVIADSTRGDEIGVAWRELAAMQGELRAALRQQERLARLGTAVSKMSHDLRNILATAQLVSDSIADSEDPEVKRMTPVLFKAIDRAVDLCSHTLRFVRPDSAPLRLMQFDLSEIADYIGGSLGLGVTNAITWNNLIAPGFEINADRDEIYRALLNISRNAVQALQGEPADGMSRADGRVVISAQRTSNGVSIELDDNGPGLPEQARTHLFKAFAGSEKSGGSGLGLTITRDIAKSHGGDLTLISSDNTGTRFRLHLPDA